MSHGRAVLLLQLLQLLPHMLELLEFRLELLLLLDVLRNHLSVDASFILFGQARSWIYWLGTLVSCVGLAIIIAVTAI